MTNRWFFTADIYKTGLSMITATAADFENIYISKYSESDTISLKLLNVKIFQNRQFNHLPTNGYHPKEGMWLWAESNGETNTQFKDMIFLGNTLLYNKGTPIDRLKNYSTTWTISTALSAYTNNADWGNPFHEDYLNRTHQLWFTTNSPWTIFAGTYINKLVTTPISQLPFQRLDQELYFEGRYNPNKDKAQNMIYFLKTTEAQVGWDPPEKESLITKNIPLWVATWGLRDYHAKLADMQHMDTDYIAVIQSKHIEPQDIGLQYYVLLDKKFTHGDSEWNDEHQRTAWDNIHWHPMLHYQHRSIEDIGQSGPAVPKLGEYKTAELHCEYKFYFKIGGCIPPMEEITDPANKLLFQYQLTSLKQIRYRVQTHPLKTTCTNLMKGDNKLLQQLQNESKKTLQLKNLCSQIQKQLDQTSQSSKHSKKSKTRRRRRKPKKRHCSSSSSTSETSRSESESESSSS